jgi:hypothetical protein
MPRLHTRQITDRDRPLPIAGFNGTPKQIERQWYEQVYRGRGDSMAQLTWRAVVMGSCLGGVLSLTNLYIGLKAGWASASRSRPVSSRMRSGRACSRSA